MANLGLENFRKTLLELKVYLSQPILTNRDRAGIIQAFEFTSEQSWKSIQKMAPRYGGQVGNPRQAYMFAIQSGWIPREAEQQWLRLLEDRNLTSHTYKEDLAREILSRIQADYVEMFERLLTALSQQP